MGNERGGCCITYCFIGKVRQIVGSLAIMLIFVWVLI